MTAKPLLSALTAAALMTLAPAAPTLADHHEADAKTLRDAAPERVLIGTAIMSRQTEEPREAELIRTQFNVLTPENEMKPISVQPERGRFEFAAGDKLVAFAEANDMEVIGHTLVWHNQAPRFLFEDEQGNPLPRDEALANMKEHITTVMTHYKGRIKGWDVVNEAIPDGPGDLRDTPALRAIGDDYILKAFEFAHEADPDAELYYNDYNIDQDYKRDRALALVKRIRDAGLRIDAVGIQGHYLLESPSMEEIRRGVEAYTDAGFDVHITELDVDPLPRRGQGGADLGAGERGGDTMDPYKDGLPDAVQQQLADRYRDLFEFFLGNEKITRVTFWGTTDAHTWLNGFPIGGRTNHPMLWARDYEAKPAFDAVFEVLEQNNDGGATTRPSSDASGSSALPSQFKWTSSELLVPPPPHPEREIVSIKDPSVVRHDGLWHIYATTSDTDGNWRMAYLNFADWDEAKDAKAVHMDLANEHFTGYHCAPQVFWFEPQQKWYLIYQSQQPQYSTSDDLSDPSSWTDGQDFFDEKPDGTPRLWIDYWVVADDTHAYLFFTGDDGKLYRSRTEIAQFPNGMGEVETVLEDPNRFNLFEGSAHYKIKGTNQYLTIIEAIGEGGVRFYRSWISDGLDGEFKPLADTWDNPFAGPSNVTHQNPDKPWTDDISHGELLRDGNDQTMTIDPANLRLLYQGQAPNGPSVEYSQLPYRLGLLTLKTSE